MTPAIALRPLGIIDSWCILSPDRVSPINADSPLAPLSEAVNPHDSAVAVVESVREAVDPLVEEREAPMARGEDRSLDLRVRLKGKDGRMLVLELDSRVLCERSEYLGCCRWVRGRRMRMRWTVWMI